MWTIGKTFLGAAIFALATLSAASLALALPVKATAGSKYCQCACRSSTDFKDLSWAMRSSCAVDTHACTFTPYGGGPQQSGKLADCAVCTAQASGTEWRCVPAAIRQLSPASPNQLLQLK